MTTENFLELMRSGQMQEDALKKHLGNYRSKDVDEYIEKLQARLRNMEELYQERYEEMRTSLLAITRERNDLSENIKNFEQKLKDIPQNCNTYLSEQGLLTVAKKDYERMQNAEAEHQKEKNAFAEKLAELQKENEQLLAKTEQILAEKKNAEEVAGKLRQSQLLAEKQASDYDQMNAQLKLQMEQVAQKQAELDESDEQNHRQELELVQVKAKYQMMEMQFRLAQEMNQQLLQDKERQDKETVKRQERFDAERTYLIQRFNGILQSQKQCMQRLQESLAAYTQSMNGLGEADFLDLSNEGSKQSVKVLNFSATASAGGKDTFKRD
ncbi:MAG: hypothetical protein ACYCX2_09660 [Christensenellales bacterium]